jgi:hypothetical protein
VAKEREGEGNSPVNVDRREEATATDRQIESWQSELRFAEERLFGRDLG